MNRLKGFLTVIFFISPLAQAFDLPGMAAENLVINEPMVLNGTVVLNYGKVTMSGDIKVEKNSNVVFNSESFSYEEGVIKLACNSFIEMTIGKISGTELSSVAEATSNANHPKPIINKQDLGNRGQYISFKSGECGL